MFLSDNLWIRGASWTSKRRWATECPAGDSKFVMDGRYIFCNDVVRLACILSLLTCKKLGYTAVKSAQISSMVL